MNTEFEGEVSLVVMGEPRTHRFKISVTAEDAIVLWLEDRASKGQWQTRELGIDDFVTRENAIPMAKLSDYTKRFAECLDGASGRDIVVEWVVGHDNSPTLKLVLPLQWSSYVATVQYVFRMEQVDLKPVDLVAARLSDVEESQQQLQQSAVDLQDTMKRATADLQDVKRSVADVQDMKRAVADLEDTASMVKDPDGDGHLSLLDHVRALERYVADMPRASSATTKTRSTTNEPLIWTPSGGCSADLPRLVEFCSDGTILIGADGLYAIVAGIKHTSTEGNFTYQLLHNKKRAFYSREKATLAAPSVVTSIKHVLEAKKDDELQFVFKGNNEATAGSYVTFWHLP